MDESALIQVDPVAESLWQTGRNIAGSSAEIHEQWLSLPDDEKNTWRAQAQVVVANQKQEDGFA